MKKKIVEKKVVHTKVAEICSYNHYNSLDFPLKEEI